MNHLVEFLIRTILTLSGIASIFFRFVLNLICIRAKLMYCIILSLILIFKMKISIKFYIMTISLHNYIYKINYKQLNFPFFDQEREECNKVPCHARTLDIEENKILQNSENLSCILATSPLHKH